jgi:hypothetical protein
MLRAHIILSVELLAINKHNYSQPVEDTRLKLLSLERIRKVFGPVLLAKLTENDEDKKYLVEGRTAKHLCNTANENALYATIIWSSRRRGRGSNGSSRGRDTYAGLDHDAQRR